MLERRKTFTMNWDNIDNDEHFFESCTSLSSTANTLFHVDSSSEDENDFDDPRSSFVSAISSNSRSDYGSCDAITVSTDDYDIWLAMPGSIKDRRKRLLQGMGISFEKGKSKELNDVNTNEEIEDEAKEAMKSSVPLVLVRSRSEGDIESMSIDKKRKDEVMGSVSKQHLTRNCSMVIVSHCCMIYPYEMSSRIMSPNNDRDEDEGKKKSERKKTVSLALSKSCFGTFVLIKNLDTGKEFIVNGYDQNGVWNKVSDVQMGKQLTLDEFESSVGHSPMVKELMQRENVGGMSSVNEDRKINTHSYLSKSLRISKKTGITLLKNIMGVASSMSSKGGDHGAIDSKQGWIKVRQIDKSYKELSALYLCQEISAHNGSIWVLKFSHDGMLLATGGDDKIIHIWEVQECSFLPLEDYSFSKRRKGSHTIPKFLHPPKTVFSLSEKPIFSLPGHLDVVLDLSWSKSQLLLSSSMDKTVRLWDTSTQTCLKLFAHNDYVTCIQFNPMDDDCFISGSLDAKVRIWSISDRKLVDWTDLHEMVTAVSFTPDGKGAFVGLHKGSCIFYEFQGGQLLYVFTILYNGDDTECKLNQIEQIDLQYKKKSQAKKITGFQFSPENPNEVLITSANSRIRIVNGKDVAQKFKGLRNANSQISACFSLDGRYVICASEDSNVYIWKHEEPKIINGKIKTVIQTRGCESFSCKDVTVAVPWHGILKNDLPWPNDNIHVSQWPFMDSASKHLPPLPRNIKSDFSHISRSPSDFGDSFTSNSSSIFFANSPSISASNTSSSRASFDGPNDIHPLNASAWGLVIVTATLNGDIRVYQNFGLPRRMGRI